MQPASDSSAIEPAIKHDDISASLKEKLTEAEQTFSMLLTIDDDVLDQLNLPTMKKLKFIMNAVSIDVDNTDNTTNDTINSNINSSTNTSFETKQSHEDNNVSSTDPDLKQEDASDQIMDHSAKYDEDMKSAYSGVASALTGHSRDTGVTGVSSVGPPIKMDDPLIVILCISEYDKDAMGAVRGGAKDYTNVIDTFVNTWKYKVFYQLNNNSFVYTNEKDELKENYKLKWDLAEISCFVEQARNRIVKNNHNGLLFAISSHGGRDKIMYLSDGEKLALDSLFMIFSPESSFFLESYQETEEESQRLFAIPKIFLLDMCRGKQKAKVTQISKSNVSSKDDTEMKFSGTDDCKDESKEITISSKEVATPGNNDSHTQNAISFHKEESSDAVTTQKNGDSGDTGSAGDAGDDAGDDDEEEIFSFKGVSKEKAATLVAQMANFCQVYANVEGMAVADGSKNGGLFLRNVCKLFKDTKFIRQHKWNDIILKIRDHTKRDATLFGLFNFTQTVENEATLEKRVIFSSKYRNLSPIQELDDYDMESSKLVITNVSKTNKIAVLVEAEKNSENRETTLDTLRKQTSNDQVFIDNGYTIIDTNGQSEEFGKIWPEVYVTLFKLHNKDSADESKHNGGNNTSSGSDDSDDSDDIGTSVGQINKDVYDRVEFSSDNLYWSRGKLKDMNTLIPSCMLDCKKSHNLKIVPNDEKTNKCHMCHTAIEFGNNMYFCSKCKTSLCHNCCHLIISKQTPLGLYPALIMSNIEYLVATSTLRIVCVISSQLLKNVTRRNKHQIKCHFLLKQHQNNNNNNNHNHNKQNSTQVLMSSMEFDARSIIQHNTGNNNTLHDNQVVIVLNKLLSADFQQIWNWDWNQESIAVKYQTIISDDLHSTRIESAMVDMSDVIQLSIVDNSSYECLFSTCNGEGRKGPTTLTYHGQCNYYDTTLDNEHEGMQLWNVPQSGKWKIVCYGAQGGDSTSAENQLSGGKGAKVGGVLTLYKNDMIRILVGQRGASESYASEAQGFGGGGGGGATFFVLYKRGNLNPKFKLNANCNFDYDCDPNIVNTPLIIASGGHGACSAQYWNINGIDGLSASSDNRDNYCGYETDGQASRGGSFKDDFDIFEAYNNYNSIFNYNFSPTPWHSGTLGGLGGLGGFGGLGGLGGFGIGQHRMPRLQFDSSDDYCLSASNDLNRNPSCFLDGGIGGNGIEHGCDGGFGGGGGSEREGGGGGGYIGGLVLPDCHSATTKNQNINANTFALYGALSWNSCQVDDEKIDISGENIGNGKIEIKFIG